MKIVFVILAIVLISGCISSGVSFESIDASPEVRHEKAAQFVIESKGELESLTNEPSDVNFNNEMVIAVFSGEKKNGGYSVQITKIVETATSLDVYVQEITPGETCITTQVISYPYHIVKTKKTDKEVNFKVTEKIRNC